MASDRSDVLITGGLLVSGQGITRSDILISEGVIGEVGSQYSGSQASRTIDATGKYVLPGGIDSHAHPIYGDKMDTYSISAAFGGITTVVAFIGSETHRHEQYGNTWGVKKYNPDIVKGFIEYAEEASYTDFAVHGLITMRDPGHHRHGRPRSHRPGSHLIQDVHDMESLGAGFQDKSSVHSRRSGHARHGPGLAPWRHGRGARRKRYL